MIHDIKSKALSKLQLGDILYLIGKNIVPKHDLKEYIKCSGIEIKYSNEHQNVTKVPVNTIVYEESVDLFVKHFSSKRITDSESSFDYLFLSGIPEGEADETSELYRVMEIFSDLGAPETLEWVMFLWPTNPYKDIPGGDRILYGKIRDYVFGRLLGSH